MKISSLQAVIFSLLLLASLGVNFISGADTNGSKPLTGEEQLINGWASGLILRCQKTIEKTPKNKACLTEIMTAGYRLRTRDFWVAKGFLKASK